MARARLIHCDISTSESVESVSEFAQLLWDRMIPHLDDFGIIEASPPKLKGRVKPLSPRPPIPDFAEAIAALESAGMILLYRADGRLFAKATNFDTYQKGLHKRTKSRHATPEDENAEILSSTEYLAILNLSRDASQRFQELPRKAKKVSLKRTRTRTGTKNGNGTGTGTSTEKEHEWEGEVQKGKPALRAQQEKKRGPFGDQECARLGFHLTPCGCTQQTTQFVS